jgi:RNA polymerase sigma-70 factor (ECF subfamily)
MTNQSLKCDAAFADSNASSEESDEVLMARICQGDKEALGCLFRRHARVVRGIAYKVLRDSCEADDLLQDVFIQIDYLCRTFDSSKASAKFWILQMTYRRAISRRRYLNCRHFYTRVDLDDTEVPGARSPMQIGRLEESINGGLARADLEKLFETLSEDQQQTLRLHFIEGYTLDEIAEKLGQSKGNVRHHSFRGLERLRRQIFDNSLRSTPSRSKRALVGGTPGAKNALRSSRVS